MTERGREIPNLDTARIILEESLAKYNPLIKLIRSWWQHRMMRGLSGEVLQHLREWGKKVTDESEGQLSCRWAELNAVHVQSWHVEASHMFFEADPDYNPNLVFARGFSFLLRHPEVTIETLLFDGGDSSKPFDDMDPALKPLFAKHFGERHRANNIYSIYHKRESGIYVAVETHDLEGYKVSTMAHAYPICALPWEV